MKSTWTWIYCIWANPRSASPLSYSLLCICTNCFELCICIVCLYRLHCSSCSCSSRRSPSRSCWSATRRLDQWTRSGETRASPGSRTRAASGWPGAWSSPGTAPGSCPHHTWPVDNILSRVSTSFLSVLFTFSISTWCSRTSSPAPSRSQCSATTCWSQSSTSEADLVLSSSLLWCRKSLDSLSRYE